MTNVNTSLADEPELRECWIFTCGPAPGLVDDRQSNVWVVHTGDINNAVAHAKVTEAVFSHLTKAMMQPGIHWSQLEWKSFELLRLRP